MEVAPVEIEYPEIGICGLSCRLCPSYHIDGPSRCGGCKSEFRMSAGCPFITCAVKRKGIEFCWQCNESASCAKWRGHREYSREHDTFVCYQKLEDNIALIGAEGIEAFSADQVVREGLLREMLGEFNEGRSKRYYSIAATVLDLDELRVALDQARVHAAGLDAKGRAKLLHGLLDAVAADKGYHLRLRK
jgi:hypothetical protein